MSKHPTDRLLGRSVVAVRKLAASESLPTVYKGFRDAIVLELDDGSLIAASRMAKPHGASELLLVEPDGESWCTVDSCKKAS